LGVGRKERLELVYGEMRVHAPFRDGAEARRVLEEVMKRVEDEHSGVREDPSADVADRTDGRMYPPHDRFEIPSGASSVRCFKQRRHRTFIGANGAFRVSNPDGSFAIDLEGEDGRSVEELLREGEKEYVD